MAVVGVDVLAKQRDFTHACLDQFLGFAHDTVGRARHLGTARIWHDAERAKFIAAFLDGQKRCWATLGFAARFECLKLIIIREICVQRADARLHSIVHRRQTVVGLRANDQINHRLAANNLSTLGLSHASGNAKFQIGISDLQMLHAAQFVVNFFSSFFANVTGIQQDHIRIVRGVGLHISFAAQRLGHAFTVINVHLTAIRLDKQLFRF